ncbi:MAG: metallophosphoesterase [Leptospira sp.]|nr:metallophosphoesterase [Leptospira sp.]
MKFALIGDIHGYWNERDVEYFNSTDYDFLFFTGDLLGSPFFGRPNFLNLKKRAYLIPGNWDGTSITGIIGEVLQSQTLIRMGSFGQSKREERLLKHTKPLTLLAYSSVILSKELDLSLIVGRPHAMGGGISFLPSLRKTFSISSVDDSINKYKALIQNTKERNLFFLSHNGPLGLGKERNSMYGADFKKMGGDFGDEDLKVAIDYAKSIGKKVPAVLSGHMHHKIGKNKERETLHYKGGTFYVNGAKVPRIQEGKHFHTKIEWDGGGATVIPIWV